MNGMDLIRRVMVLRQTFTLNGRLNLEFQAMLSKLLREYGVPVEDDLLRKLMLAVPDELMGGGQPGLRDVMTPPHGTHLFPPEPPNTTQSGTKLPGPQPPNLDGPQPPNLGGPQPPNLGGPQPPNLGGPQPPTTQSGMLQSDTAVLGPQPPNLGGSKPANLGGPQPPNVLGPQPPNVLGPQPPNVLGPQPPPAELGPQPPPAEPEAGPQPPNLGGSKPPA